MKKNKYLLIVILFSFSCVDPLPPSFDFKEDIIIINAIASTVAGATNVSVKKTIIEFDNYKSKCITVCSIDLINSDTKERISFIQRGVN